MNQSIKRYNKVNHDHSLSFRISRMEDIYTERNGKKDAPHIHDYYTVLLVKKAIGYHMIDFMKYPFAERQVYFVNPGQVHQVVEKSKPQGYALLFSEEFLVENNIPAFFIENLNLFNDHGHAPPLQLNETAYNQLSAICDEIIEIHKAGLGFFEQAVSANIQLFLIRCNNICTEDSKHTQEVEAGNMILRKYKQLINENYKQWHLTSDYANELHVTADHLNKVVKTLTGKTAKELIQARITIEAKRLMFFSDLSAKEIGYELGFAEPANFSTFFKNCTGSSPSQFKKGN